MRVNKYLFFAFIIIFSPLALSMDKGVQQFSSGGACYSFVVSGSPSSDFYGFGEILDVPNPDGLIYRDYFDYKKHFFRIQIGTTLILSVYIQKWSGADWEGWRQETVESGLMPDAGESFYFSKRFDGSEVGLRLTYIRNDDTPQYWRDYMRREVAEILSSFAVGKVESDKCVPRAAYS